MVGYVICHSFNQTQDSLADVWLRSNSDTEPNTSAVKNHQTPFTHLHQLPSINLPPLIPQNYLYFLMSLLLPTFSLSHPTLPALPLSDGYRTPNTWKRGQGLLSLRQNDFGTWWSEAQRPRWVRVGSLESLVCALEHEDGVGDFEGGSELDAHDLHNVGLCQQQEGLPVNHLRICNRHNSCDVTGREPHIFIIIIIHTHLVVSPLLWRREPGPHSRLDSGQTWRPATQTRRVLNAQKQPKKENKQICWSVGRSAHFFDIPCCHLAGVNALNARQQLTVLLPAQRQSPVRLTAQSWHEQWRIHTLRGHVWGQTHKGAWFNRTVIDLWWLEQIFQTETSSRPFFNIRHFEESREKGGNNWWMNVGTELSLTLLTAAALSLLRQDKMFAVRSYNQEFAVRHFPIWPFSCQKYSKMRCYISGSKKTHSGSLSAGSSCIWEDGQSWDKEEKFNVRQRKTHTHTQNTHTAIHFYLPR